MTMSPQPLTVAIVGAGASGTLTAANFLRRATTSTNIILIDRTGQFGRGVAYGTTNPAHVLNVPVGKMSAWPDDPNHFLRWLQVNAPVVLAGQADPARAFVPRPVYRAYLEDVLAEAAGHAAPGVSLEQVSDEVVGARPEAGSYRLTLASGRTVSSRVVILASGYLEPRDPPVADRSFYASQRYFRDAWLPGALAGLDPNESVLLIGTGLTMVDQAVALHEQGHLGTIYAVSRRGIAPIAHGPSAAHPTAVPVDAANGTARGLVRALRAEVRAAAAEGRDWRGVVDAQRPATAAHWQNLPVAEKERVLRHLVPYWDVHRHRIATEVGAIVGRMIESGQLVICAGRIKGYREDSSGIDVAFQPRGQVDNTWLRVARVINCTGASLDCRDQRPPLLEDLAAQGLVHPNALGLGLDTDASGRLLDKGGHPAPGLYAVGVLRKGDLWESTAVPELREQAAALAPLVLRRDFP